MQDPELVDKLLEELLPLQILEIGQWVAIGLGAAMVLVAGLLSFVGPWKCRG